MDLTIKGNEEGLAVSEDNLMSIEDLIDYLEEFDRLHLSKVRHKKNEATEELKKLSTLKNEIETIETSVGEEFEVKYAIIPKEFKDKEELISRIKDLNEATLSRTPWDLILSGSIGILNDDSMQHLMTRLEGTALSDEIVSGTYQSKHIKYDLAKNDYGDIVIKSTPTSMIADLFMGFRPEYITPFGLESEELFTINMKSSLSAIRDSAKNALLSIINSENSEVESDESEYLIWKSRLYLNRIKEITEEEIVGFFVERSKLIGMLWSNKTFMCNVNSEHLERTHLGEMPAVKMCQTSKKNSIIRLVEELLGKEI